MKEINSQVQSKERALWLLKLRKNSRILDRHFTMIEKRRKRDKEGEWWEIEGKVDTLHLGS
jgi:hypothetical protein